MLWYNILEVIIMAMAKAYLNVKIDKGVKESAAQLLENMGLDHTTAIDMFYRQIIKERRLPFQPESALSLDEQILASIRAKNIPEVALELDENGNAIVDKEKHPEVYDWLSLLINTEPIGRLTDSDKHRLIEFISD
jgi:DNA-damage-inducible protein J